MNFISSLSKRIGAWIAAALLLVTPAQATDYGLPTNIQDGNILHCFNWSIAQVRAELTNIAAAGFGAVQLSPLQRSDITSSSTWYDAYRPYDFCFLESGMGTKEELTALCSEADALGIKVVVDAVLNHVDGSSSAQTSYHDSWWNSGDYLRWYGDVDYNSRYSITHNQMGGGSGYPDVNSENSDVAARAKAYIEELKACGVKGIRFDAAKHIGLPSESCSFWSTVCGVSDMWYYGEILDNPGSSSDDNVSLMAEYTNYMSVTDNGYSTGVRNGGGVSSGYANWSVNSSIDDDKIVYWAESHDTYANDGGESKSTSVEVIDRAYANVASRNGATALYLSRPSESTSSSIKCATKGSTHFTDAAVAEVNKFKNAMVGKADYYTADNGVASITRSGGGAVIVNSNGGGSVSIANGGGYCPEGSYTDRISGNTFTVTSTTISGTVGSTGIAVIYDGDSSSSGSDDDDDDDDSSSTGSYTDAELAAMQTVLASNANTVFFRNSSSWSTVSCYSWTTGSSDQNAAWPGETMTLVSGTSNIYYYSASSSYAKVIFNSGSDANKTGDLTWIDGGYYEYTTTDGEGPVATITVDGDDTDTDDGDGSDDDTSTGTYTYVVSYSNPNSWSTVYCYIWYEDASGNVTEFTEAWNSSTTGSLMTNNSGTWTYTFSSTYSIDDLNIIFNNGSGTQTDNLSLSDYATSTFTATTVPVSISSVGYATFTPAYAVDLTNETDFTAYTVTATSDGSLTFNKVTTVAAGEGVLLESANGGSLSKDIEMTTETITANSNNDLVGTLTDITALATEVDGSKNYILYNGSYGLGFYQANDQSLAAGRAYLQIPDSVGAKFDHFLFNDATGIAAIATAAEAGSVPTVYYNLAGQRVSESYKGVVIVNGKKMIRK